MILLHRSRKPLKGGAKLFLVSSGPRSSQAMRVLRIAFSYHSPHPFIPMPFKLLLVWQLLRSSLLSGIFFREQVYPALLSSLKFRIALAHSSVLIKPMQKLFVHRCFSGQQQAHLQSVPILKTFWYAFLFLSCIKDNKQFLQITIASDTDSQYSDSQNRQAMLAAGKISFRTCLKSARLPGSYILGLAHASYPSLSPTGEPHSFNEAFNHWFLCEILTAIGGHSML